MLDALLSGEGVPIGVPRHVGDGGGGGGKKRLIGELTGKILGAGVGAVYDVNKTMNIQARILEMVCKFLKWS